MLFKDNSKDNRLLIKSFDSEFQSITSIVVQKRVPTICLVMLYGTLDLFYILYILHYVYQFYIIYLYFIFI